MPPLYVPEDIMSEQNAITLEDFYSLGVQHAKDGQYDIAADIFRQILGLIPNDPNVLSCYANVLAAQGQLQQAAQNLLSALRINRSLAILQPLLITMIKLDNAPDTISVCEEYSDIIGDDPYLLNIWGYSHNRVGNFHLAQPLLERAMMKNQHRTDIFHNLSASLINQGDKERSVEIYSKLSTPWDGVTSDANNQIIQSFDDMSKDYEHNDLHRFFAHRLTQTLFHALPTHVSDPVLDLGCGTGMVGLTLQERAKRIVGIDISSKMLEIARPKGCYSDLIQGDFVEVMKGLTETFNTIASASVLYHIADLEPIFREASRLLNPGGLFAFSVDPLTDDGEIGVTNVGQFCHSRRYLRRIAGQTGLAEKRIDIDVHRGPPGFWCVFQKPLNPV